MEHLYYNLATRITYLLIFVSLALFVSSIRLNSSNRGTSNVVGDATEESISFCEGQKATVLRRVSGDCKESALS